MLEDGAYWCSSILRERAGDDERAWVRKEMRRKAMHELIESLEPSTPIAIELLERTDFVPSRFGPFGSDERVTVELRIRRVQTIDVRMHKMDDEFLRVPRYLPPKPLTQRVKEWFKRTWREVQEYDGPRG